MHPIELDAILKLAKAKLRGGQGPEAEAMYRQVSGFVQFCPTWEAKWFSKRFAST